MGSKQSGEQAGLGLRKARAKQEGVGRARAGEMSRVRAIRGGGGLAFFQRVISGLNPHFLELVFWIVGGGGEAVGQNSARRGAIAPRI